MSVTINNITVDFRATPRPTVTFLQGADMAISSIQATLRSIEATVEGRAQEFKSIIRASGNESFSDVESNALTVKIQPPYIMAFEAGPVPFKTSVGNLLGDFLDSPGAIVQINNAVGATNLSSADIEYASFNGGVTIDPINGTTGTTFPRGTPRLPVNNLADARAIAIPRGFTKLYLNGSFVFDVGDNLDNLTLQGDSVSKTDVVINPGASAAGLRLKNMHVHGTLDGETVAEDCYIQDLFYIQGTVKRCVIEGVITLGGVEAYFINCSSGLPAAGVIPTIDIGDGTTDLNIKNHSGQLCIKSGITMTAAPLCKIDLDPGEIDLDVSVTLGDFDIRGTGVVVNNADPAVIVETDELVNPAAIAKAVWAALMATNNAAGSMGEALGEVFDESFGKWEVDPVAKTLKLHKFNAVSGLWDTLFKTFNLGSAVTDPPAFISRTPV